MVQHGQGIDVLVSGNGDIQAVKRFFAGSLPAHGAPVELITDKAPPLSSVINELRVGASPKDRPATAFDELQHAI